MPKQMLPLKYNLFCLVRSVVELLLDIGGEIQIQGINYNESEFDLKQWVNSNLSINSFSNK